MEEHERDIRLFKDNTALAQLNKKTEIDIDFQNPKKLTNYTNQSCAHYPEAIEIKTKRMHAIQDSMPTWMKDKYAWCVRKMHGRREDEKREAGARVHLQADDGQGVRLKLVLSKCRVII